MRARWATVVLVCCTFLAACGGGHKGASEPLGKKQFVDGPPPDAAPARLSESECTGLYEHIVKLMQEGMPADEWAAGKDDLATEREPMIKDCQEGETTRAQYDCLMRAATISDFPDCVPAR